MTRGGGNRKGETGMLEGSYRAPGAAGHFYPADRDILRKKVDHLLEGDSTLPDPGPRGIIAPHAGYDYSGPTAGVAYRELRGRRLDAVILIGPSHFDRFRGATAWPGAGYRTPLGETPYPADLLAALDSAGADIHSNRLGHREEHSVEVQLPFIQVAAPGVPVLPLVMADDRRETCERIGEVLARAVSGREIVFVASSDFYHGHSNRDCVETDERTLAALGRNDPLELSRGFDSGKFMACGRAPIQTVLWACRILGARKVEVLKRTNSDEVTGRSGGYVVGYAAAVIY
jgi:MEMO1 family protein